MALHRINDFDPNYRSHFGDRDILKFDVYSNDEKVGSIDDVLIDQGGHLRYLVVHVGTWIFGKKVLIPIGRSQIDERARRVYIDELTPEQVKRLPEYQGEPID